MADFDPPFSGTSGERRYPSTDEQAGGFPCGPADQALFNGMFYRIEAELKNVMAAGGITPNNADLTQLLQAINALIASAVGGSSADFVLMSVARLRLPIFPEIKTADYRIIINSPGAGTVRVPSGVTIQHRGIFEFATAQTDFATTASKTYHLRWNPTTGFDLQDLTNGTYNPTSAAETDPKFDTKYDDMLVARVVTNSSNVATITNLANKDRLIASFTKNTYESQNGSWTGLPWLNGTQNWARTPNHVSVPMADCESTTARESIAGIFTNYNRYTCSGFAGGYVTSEAITSNIYLSGQLTMHLSA